MVTMSTQRAIGSGPSKGICSQNESQDTEGTRPTQLLPGLKKIAIAVAQAGKYN
jgi:hypothetical protein